MKKLLYIFAILAAGWSLASCSEETFEGANGVLPLADDIDVTVQVDQETNQVTLTLNNKGCYPIWRVYTAPEKYTQSTVNGYSQIITVAGTYNVEVQMGNKNGVCLGTKTISFTLDNSIVDWTPYVTFLTTNEGKWAMDYNAKGHLGCGPSGTDGLEWWAAGPEEKKGTGMYESVLVFSDLGKAPVMHYTLDNSNGGMVYCNKDVNAAPYGAYNTHDDTDYSAPYEGIDTDFTFVVDGTELYIEFPKGTILPYLPNDYTLENPRFWVQSLNRKKMELVCDQPGVIAWHYIFAPTSELVPAEPVDPYGVIWCDPNSADNLINGGTLSLASCWWADDNWSQLGDPEVSIDGRKVNITATQSCGGSQWQGQVHLNTGVAITEGEAYDFKIVINPTQDIKAVTVKPHPEGDDGHMFSEARHDLAAYDDNEVVYADVVADFSTENLVITLDFAGTAAGTKIDVKEIIVQAHNGTTPPGPGEEQVSWVNPDSNANLLNRGALALASCWWADNNWSQQSDPEVTVSGRTATITATSPSGGSQWQGQVHFNTGVSIVEGQTYDFKIVIDPSQDLGGATVKPHPEGDDGHMFSEARHDLAAYDDNEVTYTGVVADFSTENLVITLDFPGCDAGSVIKIKEIIIQKRAGENWAAEDSDANLWWNLTPTMDFWWADNNWSQISSPDFSADGHVYTLTVNEAPGSSQWQGQVKFNTDLQLSGSKAYDFKLVIYATNDIPGATIKFTDVTDDGTFFTADRHDVLGYEDNEFKFVGLTTNNGNDIPTFQLCFDFAGTPAGTQIVIKNVVIQEHPED